ncbi:MAG: single-stranded-DNA-specific exonuclease RecJ [Bacteroidetes bacterium]|nr:MAG: single-stranded-DNA-specific exonuclease RecJ [Bacteroidota bacterium]
MNYRWTLRKKADESIIHGLTSTLKIPTSLAQVLVARGVECQEDAFKFFEPSLDDLHDPYLMDGMEKAVERILSAVKHDELIWIHGDYDVDGTASTSMMLLFLQEIGAKVEYYIPHRINEGFGLSINSIRSAKSNGAKLIITVDIGITSYDALKYANQEGLETIICDHHEPIDDVPDVFCIIDPLKPGDSYPFKHLAACGVAFKIIQGICKKLKSPEKAFQYLDFVALASAADMVPLMDENRILVHYGLTKINSKPRPGLKGLIDCTHLKVGAIDTSSIVYSLAPLINAAGRVGDARWSVDMMIEKDEVASFQIAQKLERENRKRRTFDEITFDAAAPMAEQYMKKNPESRAIVLYSPSWHAGVIGIVASRLVDRFHLPAVMLTKFEDPETHQILAKGSARSIYGFDIHKALKTCRHLLTEFGGHKHAAGLSLEINDIDTFRKEFEEIANREISTEMLVPEIVVDAELKLSDLNPNFLKVLNKFAPYGFDNNRPMFLSKGVRSSNGVKVVGKNHLKFRAYQMFEIDAIGYGLADKINICQGGKPFSILYNIEESLYNGITYTQLRIKDIKPDEQ